MKKQHFTDSGWFTLLLIVGYFSFWVVFEYFTHTPIIFDSTTPNDEAIFLLLDNPNEYGEAFDELFGRGEAKANIIWATTNEEFMEKYRAHRQSQKTTDKQNKLSGR